MKTEEQIKKEAEKMLIEMMGGKKQYLKTLHSSGNEAYILSTRFFCERVVRGLDQGTCHITINEYGTKVYKFDD